MTLLRTAALALAVTLGAQAPYAATAAPGLGGRALLHAHNCYPDRGRWTDRLERALATGLEPIAIEQDVMWVAAAAGRPGRSVVAHDTPPAGDEPTLDEHFFARVAPLLDRALADGRRDTWPRLVLHLDFKTNEPEHHEAIWKLLGRYERWLTTAVKAADDAPAPLAWGPLLVLTEAGDGQEQVFHRDVPIGQRLRLFGTVPSALRELPEAPQARAAALVAAPAAVLIPSGATNYRRWTNFPWAVVEHGGQARAADWTAEDDRRLQAIVGRAHAQGLWVRFYTLNGHAAAEDEGWSAGYNFGGLDEAERRWRAAIAAGVDLVATDQYEAFARVLTATPP